MAVYLIESFDYALCLTDAILSFPLYNVFTPLHHC